MTNEPNKDFSKTMEDIQKDYEKTIPEKLALVKGLIEKLQSNRDKPNQDALIFHLHKISGSAGCYGFKEVSIICRKMHDELLEKPLDPDVIASLTSFYQKLTEAFSYGKKG
jgi:HPt (histidine-containing phosphotransfer) domain-containing protein